MDKPAGRDASTRPRRTRRAALRTPKTFWLPKGGHRADEYEDAFRLPEGEGPCWRAAIADGATESAFAGAWARHLADGFAAEAAGCAADFDVRVRAWRAAWQAARAGHTERLPWYAAAKAEEGAFATFLGLVLDAAGTWAAVAVGDCCLFHVRGDNLLQAWPLDAPEAFHHRPALVGSRPELPVPEPEHRGGTFRAGDVFLLATDALAAWLLRTGPAAACTWTADRFEEEVTRARHQRTMRNDDVTLVVVETVPANA